MSLEILVFDQNFTYIFSNQSTCAKLTVSDLSLSNWTLSDEPSKLASVSSGRTCYMIPLPKNTFAQADLFPQPEHAQPGKTYGCLSHHTYISSLTTIKHASSTSSLTFTQIISQTCTLTLSSLQVWGAGSFQQGPQLMERDGSAAARIHYASWDHFAPSGPIDGLERHHKWVDNADHVQITTLSLSQTLLWDLWPDTSAWKA